MRIRLDIAYDGTDFHGWAAQPGLRTVQGELESALSTISRESIELTVAGRTDAGVHASGQVAHFDISESAWLSFLGRKRNPASKASPAKSKNIADLDSSANSYIQANLDNSESLDNAEKPKYLELSEFSKSDSSSVLLQNSGSAPPLDSRSVLDRESGEVLLRRANAVLAAKSERRRGYSDVVIRRAQVVDSSFDARFSALWREYVYRIADSPKRWDPSRCDELWLGQELDIEAMNEAAQLLLGEHDFLSFCKPRPGASTVRTLLECSFKRSAGQSLTGQNQAGQHGLIEDGAIEATVRADAFCHSQVRSLLGALIEVGRGAKEINWPARRLLEKSRHSGVIVAPAHPLTLRAVAYPQDPQEYARQARRARVYRGDL